MNRMIRGRAHRTRILLTHSCPNAGRGRHRPLGMIQTISHSPCAAASTLDCGVGLLRSRIDCPDYSKILVIPTGFEPVTCPLGGGCSIQLSHGTTPA